MKKKEKIEKNFTCFNFVSVVQPCVYICTVGHKEESPMQDSQGPLGPTLLSPGRSDILQASSVELSPSNSSGGTYMWDEDGLQPLGGPGTHPCDSCDESELNSLVSLSFQL